MANCKRGKAVDIVKRRALLLVDLDEVIITRLEIKADREIVTALHPSIVQNLRRAHKQIVILTHRSKSEATQILRLFNGIEDLILEVVTAEDLIWTSITTGRILLLIKKGITKSLFVKFALRKYGVHPQNIAIIDDSFNNVNAILNAGGGMGFLAPKPAVSEAEIKTFNLLDVVADYCLFSKKGSGMAKMKTLQADQVYRCTELARGTVIIEKRFRFVRVLANKIRRWLFA